MHGGHAMHHSWGDAPFDPRAIWLAKMGGGGGPAAEAAGVAAAAAEAGATPSSGRAARAGRSRPASRSIAAAGRAPVAATCGRASPAAAVEREAGRRRPPGFASQKKASPRPPARPRPPTAQAAVSSPAARVREPDGPRVEWGIAPGMVHRMSSVRGGLPYWCRCIAMHQRYSTKQSACQDFLPAGPPSPSLG